MENYLQRALGAVLVQDGDRAVDTGAYEAHQVLVRRLAHLENIVAQIGVITEASGVKRPETFVRNNFKEK